MSEKQTFEDFIHYLETAPAEELRKKLDEADKEVTCDWSPTVGEVLGWLQDGLYTEENSKNLSKSC